MTTVDPMISADWLRNAIQITEKCFIRTFFDAEDEFATRLCNLFAINVISYG